MARRRDAARAVAMAAATAGLAAGLWGQPGIAAAQDIGSEGLLDRPAWLRAWSPLHWTAGLPRSLPDGMAVVPEALLWPEPRAGLFWTAGNPGALSLELADRFGAYAAGYRNADGSFRRPLDPETVRGPFVEASGWRPFGGRGAAIGRVRVASLDMAHALSEYDLPYGGSPYVVMDTAASDLGRAIVELEGAAAWRAGPLGFGLAMGYRAHHTRTREAPVPRELSAADPAAGLGLTWALSPDLRIGLHGRWRRHAERVTMYNLAATTRVYRLQGFFEPPPQDLTTGYYTRRLEREGYAAGLSAGGAALEAAWAAFLEVGRLDERQHPTGFNHPDSDTWNTDGLTLGASVVRPFSARNGVLSITTRFTHLSGVAGRGDLPDTTTYVSDESVFHGEGELGLEASEKLRLLGRVVLRHEDRIREDHLAHVRSHVRSWTTGVGTAAVLRATERLSLSAGIGKTWYGPGGTIPNPADMGTAYGLFVAPEMALAVSNAGSVAGAVTAAWRVREAVRLWATFEYSALSAAREELHLPWQPDGERLAYGLAIGFRVGA